MRIRRRGTNSFLEMAFDDFIGNLHSELILFYRQQDTSSLLLISNTEFRYCFRENITLRPTNVVRKNIIMHSCECTSPVVWNVDRKRIKQELRIRNRAKEARIGTSSWVPMDVKIVGMRKFQFGNKEPVRNSLLNCIPVCLSWRIFFRTRKIMMMQSRINEILPWSYMIHRLNIS